MSMATDITVEGILLRMTGISYITESDIGP
jgi:hypothetical protein